MAPAPSDEGFKITDRRRQTDAEPIRTDAGVAPAPSPGPEAPSRGTPDLGRSLAGLFVMFASSALIALGESPDPLTGQVQTNLEQAGEAIDILALLREKTEGNRTPEETQLLEQLIYDLQLRFVRATGPRSG